MASERSAPALFGPGCAAGLVLGALACVMPALLPLWLSAPMAVAGGAGWLLLARRPGLQSLGLAWATLHGHWALHGQLPPARRRMCG